MANNSIPLRQCSRKDRCVNPLGAILPATTDHFRPDKKTKSGLRSNCRECDRADSRQYEVSHKAQRRKSKRLYYQNNRAARVEYSRRYRAEHPEQALESSRRYHRDHREERRAYSKQYRAKHRNRILVNLRLYWKEHSQERRKYREQHKERDRQRRSWYYQSNPKRALLYVRQRRARTNAAGGTHTLADVELQYQSQKGLCWWCGTAVGDNYHVDHRIPLSRGGSNAPDNLCISCAPCNLSKNNRMPWEFNGRLL